MSAKPVPDLSESRLSRAPRADLAYPEGGVRPDLRLRHEENIAVRGWRPSRASFPLATVARGSPRRIPPHLRAVEFRSRAWKDHGRLYSRKTATGRQYMYVSEPYGLHEGSLAALLNFCSEHDLQVWINPWAVWNPTACLSIWIARKDVNLRS